MSNLFDAANKNVRGNVRKKTQRFKGFGIIAKTRKGCHINQGVDKSGCFFSLGPGRGMKKGSSLWKRLQGRLKVFIWTVKTYGNRFSLLNDLPTLFLFFSSTALCLIVNTVLFP